MSEGHVLILVENEPYPMDGRVRKEADALTEAGDRVTVISPSGRGWDAREEEIDGVRALRYPNPPVASGAVSYLHEYAHALWWMRRLVRQIAREDPPDVVIACNPPDFLLLAARSLRRRGAAFIFDHHDLSAELFEAKFGRRGPIHRLLQRAERYAFRTADVVMSTNESYADIARQRGSVDPGRIFIVRNGPEPGRIYPVEPDTSLRGGYAKLVVWIGGISAQEGLEALLHAAAELRNRGRDDVLFAIVGDGDALARIQAEAGRLGLGDSLVFPGRVADAGVRSWMSSADVCLSVDPPNSMNDNSTMVKVLEYMALARPVVQTPLKQMVRLCGDTTLYTRPDASDLADRVLDLVDDPAAAAELGERAQARITAENLTWPDQVPSLLEALRCARTNSS